MVDNPRVIQGGMGAGVSNYTLAREVSKAGGLGVVSGTALDSVLVRRLQTGDLSGDMRRALETFPLSHWVAEILDTFYIEGGKPEDKPFKLIPMPSVHMEEPLIRLMIVANYVEVWLAKESHTGVIGINYLEKIQLPTLPCIYGAMLAGVDYILMGAGIPIAIPGIMDSFAAGKPATLRIHVEENPEAQVVEQLFDPAVVYAENPPILKRPRFLAIVSSHLVAKTMERKASGEVYGYIIETHVAGGHNAPPRQKDENGNPFFGPKDDPNWTEFQKIEKPFWIAGGYASPERLVEAEALGAVGIQVGTLFAFCSDSGLTEEVKDDILGQYLRGELEPRTDFRASPTGFPFKLVPLSDQKVELPNPSKICDLGYLRHTYLKADGELGYRCPSEPEKSYIAKGGKEEDTLGRRCLCNGLMANIGLAQVKAGIKRPMLITAGEDFSFLKKLIQPDKLRYSAKEALSFLLTNKLSFQR